MSCVNSAAEKVNEPVHRRTTSPEHSTLRCEFEGTQDDEQKGLEAWARPWTQPSQEDP